MSTKTIAQLEKELTDAREIIIALQIRAAQAETDLIRRGGRRPQIEALLGPKLPPARGLKVISLEGVQPDDMTAVYTRAPGADESFPEQIIVRRAAPTYTYSPSPYINYPSDADDTED